MALTERWRFSSDTPLLDPHGPFLGRRVLANLMEQTAFFFLLPLVVNPATGSYLVGWLASLFVVHVVILSVTATTPFKWLVRLGVASHDGARVSVGQAMVRATAYAAPVLLGTMAAAIGEWASETGARFDLTSAGSNVVASSIGAVAHLLAFAIALSVLFCRDGRGWPDKLAGTQVVRLQSIS